MSFKKEFSARGTGVIYDEQMANYSSPWKDSDYYEVPERYHVIMNRCFSLGLIDKCNVLKGRKANETEILAYHTQDRITTLKEASEMTEAQKLKSLSSKYNFVNISPNIYESALLAVGCSLTLMENVVSGKLRNGMAIIRPPGHHAMKDEFNGYCYFNNIVLTALDALKRGVERILIVDWDAHFGQGTLRAFISDPRVLFFSIHRFEYGNAWPNLLEGDFHTIGEGEGKGFTINIPLNVTHNSDSEYLKAFHEILMPIAFEFNPELVLVSAGYDAAIGCPEGEQNVTPACFAHMTHCLTSLANGRVVLLLEGGYCLTSLAQGVVYSIKTLLGCPVPRLPAPLLKPKKELLRALRNVKAVLQPYWTCFQVSKTTSYVPDDPIANAPPLNLLASEYQSEEMKKEIEALITSQVEALDSLTVSMSPTCFSTTDKQMINSEFLNIKDYDCLELSGREANPQELKWLASSQYHKFSKNQLAFGSLFQVIDHVMEYKSQRGVFLANQMKIPDLGSFYIESKYKSKKVLYIIFDSEDFILNQSTDSTTELRIKFIQNDKGFEDNKMTKYDLTLKVLPQNLLSSLYKILLPLGYLYDPDVIMIYGALCSDYFQFSAYSQFLHGLLSLAEGKMIIVFEASHQINHRVLTQTLFTLSTSTTTYNEKSMESSSNNNEENIQMYVDQISVFWPELKDS